MRYARLFAGLAFISAYAQPPALAADCIDHAGQMHRVNADVLRAMVSIESGGNSYVVHRNLNGSIDIGAAQINSVHFQELARYGIRPEHLLDGCTNVLVRAWLYRKKVDKYGNTWAAVGATHSETPVLRDRYACAVAQEIGVRTQTCVVGRRRSPVPRPGDGE